MLKFNTWRSQANERMKNIRDSVLWSNKWLQIKEIVSDEFPDPYTYVTGNDTVAILPFTNVGQLQVGVRKEIIPPWNYDYNMCCVGGSIEEGEKPIDTAIKELREETGFIAFKKDFYFCKKLRDGKATDSYTYYYLVNVRSLAQEEIQGDGSIYENVSEYETVTEDEVRKCEDSKLHLLLGFLKEAIS